MFSNTFYILTNQLFIFKRIVILKVRISMDSIPLTRDRQTKADAESSKRELAWDLNRLVRRSATPTSQVSSESSCTKPFH